MEHRATIKDDPMTIATRIRSFVSRFAGSLRAPPTASESSTVAGTKDAVAESLRDTIPVRRWQCQRLPFRLSLRWPERRADRDSS
jgi:hypothetical protein